MFGTNELGDEASAEELAEWCGIDFKATDSKLIPVQQYQQTGFVASAESGAEPDPPHVVVANYELPDGSRRVLTSDEYAEILERETTLPEMQAKVHARRVVGQKPDEIAKAIGRADGTVKKHLARISEARSKARDQLEEAQRTLALLDANPSGGDDE